MRSFLLDSMLRHTRFAPPPTGGADANLRWAHR